MHIQKRRVAIYARVSTKAKKETKSNKGQDTENQLRQLRAWCDSMGHEIVQEYAEHESGRKGTESRKALSALLLDAHQHRFDLVLFWSLDRFSREGMSKTVSYLQRLHSAGVSFHSYTEEFLSTDNELVRDILLAVMSSLAKQEAIKISERTKAGLDRARSKGKTLGRSPTDPKIMEAIRRDKTVDPSVTQQSLATRYGVSRGVVQTALAGSLQVGGRMTP